jgi:hypothetical protein
MTVGLLIYTESKVEVNVEMDTFLTSALHRDEWLASFPGCFLCSPQYHWTGVWVDCALDVVVKRKIPVPARNYTPVIQPISWVH